MNLKTPLSLQGAGHFSIYNEGICGPTYISQIQWKTFSFPPSKHNQVWQYEAHQKPDSEEVAANKATIHSVQKYMLQIILVCLHRLVKWIQKSILISLNEKNSAHNEEHSYAVMWTRAVKDSFILALRLISVWKTVGGVIYNAAQLYSVSVCTGNTHTPVSSHSNLPVKE